MLRLLRRALALASLLACALALPALPVSAATVRTQVTDQAWVSVCATPCRVRVLGTQPALIVQDTSAPGSLGADATVLTSAADPGADYTASGQTIYARALNGTTSLAVLPIAAGGGGGGGSANPYPGADYAKDGTDPASPPVANAGTGLRGWLATVAAKLGGLLTVFDANNAAYGSATAMTAGTTYPAGRSVGVVCTTAGTITFSLSGGGTIALPVAVGWQTFPFSATAFAFSNSAAGSVTNLN